MLLQQTGLAQFREPFSCESSYTSSGTADGHIEDCPLPRYSCISRRCAWLRSLFLCDSERHCNQTSYIAGSVDAGIISPRPLCQKNLSDRLVSCTVLLDSLTDTSRQILCPSLQLRAHGMANHTEGQLLSLEGLELLT